MGIIEIELPPLYPLQEVIVKKHARFKVLSCGRRFGKTRLCANVAFQNAINGKKVWWVAPVYSVAMIGWRLVLSLVYQLPKDLGIGVNIADKTITFPGNGFISFKSADHPENLRGEGLDLLIMDEADFCKESVWSEVLRPSLADRKGSAIFISTPYKEGGWFHKLYLSGYPGNPRLWQRFKNTPFPYYNEPLSQDKNVLSFQFSSYCNPFIDPLEIDAAEKTSTNIVFEREFLAHFVSAAGARVKKEWLKTVNVIPERVNVAIGADLAISEKTTADYTAISVLCQDRKTRDIIIAEIKRGRWSFRDQQTEIINMANKWALVDPFLKIGIEDNQYQKALVQEVSRNSKYAVVGVHATKDKISRFASLESKYQHGQVFHMYNLPIEFEAELLSFPVGEHDDMVDSLYDAYFCFDPVVNTGIVAPTGVNSNTVFKRTQREKF
jgi:predicted phage terminase large subunit-like protein